MAEIKARPTTYKGVKMRSRLEAGFAHWLDQVNFAWEYEPGAFGDGRGQYLPDFMLRDVPCMWTLSPATVYVEVKPWSKVSRWLDNDEGDLTEFEREMRRMAVIWSSEPDAVLVLATNSPDPDDRLLHLDITASVSRKDPWPWPCRIMLSYGPNLTPGFASRLEHEPWTGRYWEFR